MFGIVPAPTPVAAPALPMIDVLAFADGTIVTGIQNNMPPVSNLTPVFKHIIPIGSVPPIVPTEHVEIESLIFIATVELPYGYLSVKRCTVHTNGLLTADIPACFIEGKGLDGILGLTPLVKSDEWYLRSWTQTRDMKTGILVAEQSDIKISIVELKVRFPNPVNIMLGDVPIIFPGGSKYVVTCIL